MGNPAVIYDKQGQHDEAEVLGKQVMETSKIKVGADHPDTLGGMAHLALTWKDQRKHKEALILMEQSAQSSSRVLGPRHPTHGENGKFIVIGNLKWKPENWLFRIVQFPYHLLDCHWLLLRRVLLRANPTGARKFERERKGAWWWGWAKRMLTWSWWGWRAWVIWRSSLHWNASCHSYLQDVLNSTQLGQNRQE